MTAISHITKESFLGYPTTGHLYSQSDCTLSSDIEFIIGGILGSRAYTSRDIINSGNHREDGLSVIICGRYNNKLDVETFENRRPDERIEELFY